MAHVLTPTLILESEIAITYEKKKKKENLNDTSRNDSPSLFQNKMFNSLMAEVAII